MIIKLLMSLLLSILISVGYFPTPGTGDPITPKDADNVELMYALVSDVHINYMSFASVYTENLLKNMSACEYDVDALVVAGDITENCLDAEWNEFAQLINEYGAAGDYVLATGNHDIRLRTHSFVVDRFSSCYNSITGESLDSLYYAKKIGGCTFIVLGSDEQSLEKQVINAQQLEWLDSQLSLAAQDSSPIFVVCHQPLKNTHGLPQLWNNGMGDSGHVGEQSQQIYEILNKYEDVILISGHLHTGFGEYNYEKIGNIHSINLPSLARANADGEYCENGIGYMVEVYDGQVIFRARDFAKGVYLPDYDINVTL